MKFLFKTVLFFLLLMPTRVFSNVLLFEGSINLVRETIFDTTKITINVQNSMVRFDETDSKGQKRGSFLVDLNAETIVAFHHASKTYTYLPARKEQVTTNSKIEYIRTENYMDINGVRCYQWRVKDRQRNTEITYWVTSNSIDFFPKLMRLLSRTDLSFNIFGAIPISEGFMPMLTVERTMLRKEKLKVQVVEILEAKVNRNLFSVPANYRQVFRQN